MKWIREGSFSLATLPSGLHLLVHPTAKFKSTVVRVLFHHPLGADATRNALLPFVLKRGTRRHPDTASLTHRLDDLYGASFDVDILKVGERQLIDFRLHLLGDRYAPRGARLLEKGFRFLREVLREPLRENAGFSREFCRTEKRHLRRLIESRINEKARYAAERLVEEMCRDEPYGIHELGDPAHLRGITNRSLFRHWERWIESAPVEVYVVGDVDRDRLADTVSRSLVHSRDERRSPAELPAAVRRRPRRVRNVEEVRDVLQGKLAIGYRTALEADDPGIPALQLANAILGGGTYSKLFRFFREGASLAYYAYSSLERVKGLLTIHAGIDPRDFRKGMRIIRKQVADLRRGQISDFEVDSARQYVLHRLRAMEDSAASLVRTTLVSRVSGHPRSVRQSMARYRRVTRDEIVEAARSLSLDTVYFLRAPGRR
jgi:predicted Zn-dependent peptidase